MRTVVRTLAQTLAITLLLGAGIGPSQAFRSRAHAQGVAQATAPQKARARELYTQGQQLFRQGDFVNAQRSFEDAYRAVPNPVVLLSIAECQVRAENYTAAVATLKQYLNEKPNAPDRAQVESQISSLESKPGTVAVESDPPAATIWVDGENTGYLTPNEISVHSGHHTISLVASGYQTVDQAVEVPIGSRQRVSLALTAVPVAATSTQEPVPTSKPVEEPSTAITISRHTTPAFWTAIGIGAAAGVTGAVLGGFALEKVHQYDDTPKKSIADRGNRLALFADVNYGICAAAGITALVLYLTSGHKEELQSRSAFRVAPEVGPTLVGMSGHMQF